MNTELIDYVFQAKKAGLTSEEISSALKKSGWDISHFVDLIDDFNQSLYLFKQKEFFISVNGVSKNYGDIKALEDIYFNIKKGTVTALLGPNGAGKTTLIKIMTTLLKPDKGAVNIGGFEVLKEPYKVREIIGLAGQYASIDENLTGFENLNMIGRLYHLDKGGVQKRAVELLNDFGLLEASSRIVKNYSGGMKRRLDLAASLISRPQVLFLDEPTNSLDPASRQKLWGIIRNLSQNGTTVILTTQYLEEADNLAGSIIVLDHGNVIAKGTADELKTQIGGDVLEFHIHNKEELNSAARAIESLSREIPQIEFDFGKIVIPVRNGMGTSTAVEAIRLFDEANIKIQDLVLRRPTLDDVFLALTGHRTEEKV
ncbi:MAG: ATP-binding cassette domain-containing protein [Patescibacteria group bacterium]